MRRLSTQYLQKTYDTDEFKKDLKPDDFLKHDLSSLSNKNDILNFVLSFPVLKKNPNFQNC